VAAAHWQEAARRWDVTLEDGSHHSARFLITAVGPLSAPTMPRIEGVETFQGQSCHTARWPHEPVSFAGKRVAVIGTGATGVQTIQEVAKTAGHLTVFQRTPNWCAPLHNSTIDAAAMAQIKAGYPEMFRRCQETFACFLHTPDPRGTFEVTPEEREAFWERLYAERGFGIWQGNFRDILTDRAANAAISDFVARKIRQRVKDPKVADKLIPKNHGFGTRRVPL
jgi:cation diffusion facilitator CzcD-associated flavoprotein CzcO